MAVLRLCFLLGVALVESLYALSCLSCDKALCLKPINCKGGYVKGVCGCCDVCAKIQGERCGGPWHIHGQCAKRFKCVSRSQMKNQKGFLPEYFQTGICEPDACEQKECGFRQVCIINRRGKPVCKCPRNCGKIRKPVCGLLNGKQYRNKCKLNREECITKREIGMLAGKCKKCTFKGQKYKFGETRPDVKPCEICTCRHSSWKCQMKPNCSMNNLPKYTNGRHTCLVSQDGKDFVLPCPKGFACKLPIADKKLDTVLVGVCKKEKVEIPKKVPRFFEIISYSNIALTKEDLSEKNEGTKSPTGAISESEFSAEIYSTKPNTDFVSTVAPTMGTLKKQQLKGGLIRHVCMAKADKGTCRPALLTRWFYNASSKSCEQFKYGGCAGNFNNFLSKEKCQEVCHSELNHRDLWEPSPTTQSSPLFMTTKLSEKHNTDILMEMCHDMKTGMSYRDGEKWSLDECTSCTCVSGRALCIAANCRVTCLEPRKIEGKCCPECEPDLEHSDISGKAVDTIKTSCEDTKTGVRYNSGESWSRNECVHCNCFNGETSCMTSVCAKPLCEHPITTDGVCCPVCPKDEKQVPTPTAEIDSKCKDQSSGELYSIGEAWNVNECVTCFCGKEGQSICHELTCLELKCKNPVHLQGRCCPVCPESFLSACTYDNRPYFQGDLMLLEDMCTLCKCDGNAWNCTDMHCNKSANGIDSSFNIKLEKLNKVKQDRTPNDGWENLSNEELDEFIVEDPMRMTRQSNKKQIAPNDKKHSPTTTSINQELFAMFNKRKSSTSSRTNDESYPVDTLTVTNENIDKFYTEKPQLGSTNKPDANIKTQSLLKEYKNRMWPSGYEDIFRASNYTTIYRTKRL